MVQYTITLRTEWKAQVAERGLRRLQKQTDKLKNSFNEAFTGGGGAFAIRGIATETEHAVRGLTIALGALSGTLLLLGRQAVNVSADFEIFRVTLEVLTGSIERAGTLLTDLKEFAVRTPLTLRDIEAGSATLLAFGETADDVIPILTSLGQAAVALDKPLNQFIRARNLLQQGIVLSRTLAPLGINRETLERFGAGVGATGEQLVEAFDKALRKFEGLFVRTFDTIRGRFVNLRDELDVMFAAIGDPLRDQLIELFDEITSALKSIRAFAERNSQAISDAFKIILDGAKVFIVPVTLLFNQLGDALKRNPALLSDLAKGINVLIGSLVGLVIIGNITVGILKLLVAITLFDISLPHLTRTLAGFGAIFTRITASFRAFILANALAVGQTSLFTHRLSNLAFGMRVLLRILGRIVPQIALVILAFRNWKDVLALLDSIIDLVTAAISPFLDAINSLVTTIPGMIGVMELLDDIFRGIANSITVIVRGIIVLLEHWKFMRGLSNDLVGSIRDFDEALQQLGSVYSDTIVASDMVALAMKQIGDAVEEANEEIDDFDIGGAIREFARLTRELETAEEGLEKFNIVIELAGIEADLAARGLNTAGSAIDDINTSDAVSQISNLTDEFMALTVAAKASVIATLVARGFVTPTTLIGPPAPGTPQELGVDVTPAGFELLEGNKLEDILRLMGEAGQAFEDISLENLREQLGLDIRGRDGGRGRDKLTAEQEKAIRRLEEWNSLTARLTEADRIRTFQIENQNILGLAQQDIIDDYNTVLASVVQRMSVLNQEQKLQLDNTRIFEALLDNLGRQLNFIIQPNLLDKFADGLINAIDSLNDMADTLRDNMQRFLEQAGIFTPQQQIEHEAFRNLFMGLDPETQGRLVVQGDILDQPGFEGLRAFAETIQDFVGLFTGDTEEAVKDIATKGDIFLSGLENALSRFLRRFGDISATLGGGPLGDFGGALLGLGGQAFGASLFGKGALLGRNVGGLLAGLGPDIVSSLAIGAAGFAINRLFGTEKALEIKGPVDVNIVDISANAANFFSFRGFEGFTFTGRFKSVFESSLF